MALKLTYSSRDDIPQFALDADLYTEKDGKWVLTGVEGMKTDQDVANVQEALRKEKEDHKATKEKLRPFAELGKTAEELGTMDQEFEELKIKVDESHKTDEEKLNQLVEAKQRPLLKQIETLTAERDEFKQSSEEANRKVVEGQRRDAVIEAITKKEGIRKDATAAIMKFASEELKFDDSDLEFRTDAGLNASEWLDGFCDSNPYVMEPSKGSGARGGDAGDRTGDDPFVSGNITAQMRLKKSDPVRFEKLKKRYEESHK